MDVWATNGMPPPESRIPRREDGTLIDYADWKDRFPSIPGCTTPAGPNPLPLLDFGPDADNGILTKEPPEIVDSEGYTVLVPAPDADGNDMPGVRAPIVQVPLATYTGWNLRREGQGKGAMHQFTGGMIDFPLTESERQMTGDPRMSIEERYGSQMRYQEAVVNAAIQLCQEGLLLEEDVG
jgi:hypothetical protein